jgi:hypothetical protein
MGGATVVTLIGLLIAVAAIAAYLIVISYNLYKVSFELGTVLIGVRAIVHQIEPVAKYVAIVLNEVAAINQAAEQLLSWGGPGRQLGGRRAVGRGRG